MKAYSIDLRQKIFQAYERGVGSQRVVAELFGVSVSFVEKLFIQLRSTGSVEPKPHAGGLLRGLMRLRDCVCENGCRSSLTSRWRNWLNAWSKP